MFGGLFVKYPFHFLPWITPEMAQKLPPLALFPPNKTTYHDLDWFNCNHAFKSTAVDKPFCYRKPPKERKSFRIRNSHSNNYVLPSCKFVDVAECQAQAQWNLRLKFLLSTARLTSLMAWYQPGSERSAT